MPFARKPKRGVIRASLTVGKAPIDRLGRGGGGDTQHDGQLPAAAAVNLHRLCALALGGQANHEPAVQLSASDSTSMACSYSITTSGKRRDRSIIWFRRVQRASLRPTESLAEAGVESTVGGVGDSLNNALADYWLYGHEVCKTTHHEQRFDHQTAGA